MKVSFDRVGVVVRMSIVIVAFFIAAPDQTLANDEGTYASSDALPPLIELRAERGEETFSRKPLPCPAGKLNSTLEIVRAVGPRMMAPLPVVAIGVEAGNHRAFIADIMDDQPGSHFALTNRVETTEYSGVPFSNRLFGPNRPVRVSVMWDSNGLITATVNGMETHGTQLHSPPRQISFGVSSAVGHFRNSQITCIPARDGR